MKSQKNIIYSIIALLSVLCIIFSIVILVQKTTNNESINNFCSAVSPSSQCELVQNSEYGKILGIDNPWYGILGFAILTVLGIMQYYSDNKFRKYIIILGSFISGMIAIWFLYLQRYVLKAYCVFCIFVDIISIILLGIAIYFLIKKNNVKNKEIKKV